jgi:DNA polymerase I-like protein with 3'-5' exonuclease and polymerase domains
VRFTSAANGYFQALAADGMKAALRVVSRECNDRRLKSPLFGSRFIFVPHDEFIMEHPEDVAPEAAARVGEVMVAEMAPYVPDVAENLSAEPALMRRWYKGAEAVYDLAGRLVPWEPE